MPTKHNYNGLSMCPRCHGRVFYVGQSLILCATLKCDFACERRSSQMLATCECMDGRHVRPHWQATFPFNETLLDA